MKKNFKKLHTYRIHRLPLGWPDQQFGYVTRRICIAQIFFESTSQYPRISRKDRNSCPAPVDQQVDYDLHLHAHLRKIHRTFRQV